MTNTITSDRDATLTQVRKLALHGAELVRVAVPDLESARILPGIVEDSPVPIVADVHFDADLALLSLAAGVAKLRLNPGNIRKQEDVEKIVEEASSRGVPIRIGVNSGSVPGDLREEYGSASPECLWAAALRHVQILEKMDFRNTVISLKSSSVETTIRANRLAARECDYPLHLGVTEAGTPLAGSIRSACAMTVLLREGIGDTIRVSLSGDPVTEVFSAWAILSATGIRSRGPVVISCPTCARSRIDVATLAMEVEESVSTRPEQFSIAIMGCEVNGPGEARDADIALIGTGSGVVLFRSGTVVDRLELPVPGVATGPGSIHLTDHLKSILDREIEKLKRQSSEEV